MEEYLTKYSNLYNSTNAIVIDISPFKQTYKILIGHYSKKKKLEKLFMKLALELQKIQIREKKS